jgi:hypothetical protein
LGVTNCAESCSDDSTLLGSGATVAGVVIGAPAALLGVDVVDATVVGDARATRFGDTSSFRAGASSVPCTTIDTAACSRREPGGELAVPGSAAAAARTAGSAASVFDATGIVERIAQHDEWKRRRRLGRRIARQQTLAAHALLDALQLGGRVRLLRLLVDAVAQRCAMSML